MHHGLFLAILLVGAAPTLWRQWLKFRTWPCWLLAFLMALLITGPIVYKIHGVVQQHRIEREREVVASLSAVPGDYLQAYGGQLIEIPPANASWRMLSAGWIKTALAVLGLAVALKGVDSRRWASFLFVTAVLAFLLSLGPNLCVFGWRPWWSLAKHVPVFADVRSVLRFAFFVQMVVVIFAATGVYWLHQTCCGRWKGRRSRVAMRSVLALVALTALLEVRVRPGQYASVPDLKQHGVWVDYVRKHTPADHAIACCPLAPGYRAADFQRTAEWMYLGSFHGVPMVNGYSTHYPQIYHSVRHELMNEFPSEEKLRGLVRLKIKFLVLAPPTGADYAPSDYNVTLGDYWLKHVCADQKVHVVEVGRKTPWGD